MSDNSIAYQTIKNQNKTIHNSIRNMSEMYSTDNNRKLYKIPVFEKINNVSMIIFYIYYAIFLIFMLLIYFNKEMLWWIKLLLVTIFLVYPYMIYFAENWIYKRILKYFVYKI